MTSIEQRILETVLQCWQKSKLKDSFGFDMELTEAIEREAVCSAGFECTCAGNDDPRLRHAHWCPHFIIPAAPAPAATTADDSTRVRCDKCGFDTRNWYCVYTEYGEAGSERYTHAGCGGSMQIIPETPGPAQPVTEKENDDDVQSVDPADQVTALADASQGKAIDGRPIPLARSALPAIRFMRPPQRLPPVHRLKDRKPKPDAINEFEPAPSFGETIAAPPESGLRECPTQAAQELAWAFLEKHGVEYPSVRRSEDFSGIDMQLAAALDDFANTRAPSSAQGVTTVGDAIDLLATMKSVEQIMRDEARRAKNKDMAQCHGDRAQVLGEAIEALSRLQSTGGVR